MDIQYIENGDLALFDGLKFRRDKRTGYYLNAKTHERLHRYVWAYYNGAIPDGYHIHHKDENKRNNSLDNLACMPGNAHTSHHSRKYADENHEKMVENLVENAIPKASAWHKSDEGRAWHRENAARTIMMQKQTEMICDFCGKTYLSFDHSTNRFCSNNCRAAQRRKDGKDNEERTCQWCGKKYTTNRYSKGRTCSRTCRLYLRWKESKIEVVA